MSALPLPAKVAGSHLHVYEVYYKLVDPSNHGHVGPKEAADFLKKSHLSETVLIRIWDLADPNSRGYLDKAGMFVALKLCAIAQQGHDLNISNIYMDLVPPKMGDIKIPPVTSHSPLNFPAVNKSPWSVSPVEREKYLKLFQSLEPVGGFVSGNKVKGVLMDSKLPLETLGKIWDLADIDRDGRLNLHEFIVAMHLVYKALEKHAIPNTLPPELMDQSTANLIDSVPKPQIIPPAVPPPTTQSFTPDLMKEQQKIDWVVSQEDQKAATKLFIQADKDLDGFVSGAEIKDVFFQSGLPQTVLAHIWSLSDISQSGKLNNEQFALAMWLIKQKLSNKEIPDKLAPNMIPPSFRKKNLEANLENNNICSYTNPELDMINKDIIEIIREKHTLEQDISQKEADIKIKNGEIKSLQSELDTLAATLRQLDSQKGEAQKRLNDLKAQVDKLRQQAEDQESTLRVQEDELNTKRQEIESLKTTEHNLEMQQNECKNKLNSLSNDLQNTQLKISQTRTKMTQLENEQHQILEAITQYDAALNSGNVAHISESSLMFKLDTSMYITDYQNNVGKKHSLTNGSKKDLFEEQGSKDTFMAFNDNFGGAKEDPFKAEFTADAHNEAFPKDPFEKSYDPFNDGASQKSAAADSQVKDPFGEDPFAALHAPVKSESPSPALPPKKSKQPPPRPAPPKSVGSLSRGSTPPVTGSIMGTSDPFAEKVSPNVAGDAFGFADFAKFDQ